MVVTLNTDKNPTTLAGKHSGRIAYFTNSLIASKLMAMGVLPGSYVELVRRAPFGGGWYTRADNLLLALRREEINSIVLQDN